MLSLIIEFFDMKTMKKNLAKNGVTSVDALLNSDPEQVASKISGISSKMINEWQANAKALLSA